MRSAPSRGMTLIEVMTASAILGVALLGLFSSHVTASARMAGGNKETEATAMAQELANLLAAIPYTAQSGGGSALLGNALTTNDTDITDAAGQLDVASPTFANLVDHSESELPAGLAATLTPINRTNPNNPGSTLYGRYWNIAPIPDPVNSANTGGVAIAAIVRYQVNGIWKHVTVITTRFDGSMLRE